MADKHREGMLIRDKVEELLLDETLEVNRRIEVLAEYLDAVVSPFRDMLV